MPAENTVRKHRLHKEILSANTIAEDPCADCYLENRECFIMPGSGLKCAECVRMGRPCVNMSWSSLDKTREEYEKKVEEDEKELAAVIARLLRDKRILAQAKERARKKTVCLAAEMEAEGESVHAETVNCPAADALVGYSATMWSTLDLVDGMASIPEPSAVPASS